MSQARRGLAALLISQSRWRDALDLLKRAIGQGLGFAPGPLFFADARGTNCLRLNFSTHAPGVIREAIARLGRLIPGSSAAAP